MKRGGGGCDPSKSSVICGAHFNAEDFEVGSKSTKNRLLTNLQARHQTRRGSEERVKDGQLKPDRDRELGERAAGFQEGERRRQEETLIHVAVPPQWQLDGRAAGLAADFAGGLTQEGEQRELGGRATGLAADITIFLFPDEE